MDIKVYLEKQQNIKAKKELRAGIEVYLERQLDIKADLKEEET